MRVSEWMKENGKIEVSRERVSLASLLYCLLQSFMYRVWTVENKIEEKFVYHNMSRRRCGKKDKKKTFSSLVNPLINLITSDRNWQNKSQSRDNKPYTKKQSFRSHWQSLLFNWMCVLIFHENQYTLCLHRSMATDERLRSVYKLQKSSWTTIIL